jgi:hypothetical protein
VSLAQPQPRWLVACDLDRTLIYSRRAAGPLPVPELVAVEHLDGAPASFLTARAHALLRELAAAALLVPVTTRTLAQYRRVDLSVPLRYAIVANGGHLLVDGRPDEGWARAVRARLRRAGLGLAEVMRRAEALADPAWARTLRSADDLFAYVVAHHRERIPDLSELAAWLRAGGWTTSVQGRKVYLVPATLTKAAALAELRRRCGYPPVAAAGDSGLDREMLEAAEAAVRPAHGELQEQGWAAPRVQVVPASGAAGGEAVLARLLDIVAAPPPARTGRSSSRRTARM